VKPIGTITKYYPFINSAARTKIEQVMNLSFDFSDFVSRLYDTIKNQKENPHLKFLVVLWCYELRKHKELRQLHHLCFDNPYCHPFLVSELVNVDDSVGHDYVIDSIKDALNLNLENWITVILNIFLFSIVVNHYYETPLIEQVLNEIKILLHKNAKLDCFSPTFYITNAFRYRDEGDSPSALEEIEKAYKFAKKYDDIRDIARSHLERAIIFTAYYMHPSSDREVRENLRKALERFRKLGDKRYIGKSLNVFGVYCGTRGEFDEALNCFTQSLKILENFEEPIYEIPHNICAMYCAIGNSNEALEWAKVSFDAFLAENRGIEYGYLDLAWAYILQGKIDDATNSLDIAKEWVLKSGLEPALAWWYRVEGLLEKAKGNYNSAMESLLASYKIILRNKRRSRLLMCLCDLAEIEVELLEPTRENWGEEYSGPWLQKAEETMLKEDLPGFIAIVKIIKAELRMKQGRHNEARSIVAEVSKIAENVGLEYLKPQLVALQASFIR
jgi:tetratricopeptide (TPR) repeat protein